MIGGDKLKKKKSLVIILVIITLVTLFSASSIASAGKAFFWLVTDGDIEPQSVYVEYDTIWTGQGLEQRIAHFQWYVDTGGDRARGAPIEISRSVGGAKAILSMTGDGNDWQLNIQIYKGGANKPSIGPEIYQWNIINGKDAFHDTINVVFTDTLSGKTSKSAALNDGDIIIVGIPHGAEFTCRMWLI